jgi:hypothetical protein
VPIEILRLSEIGIFLSVMKCFNTMPFEKIY